MRPYPTTISNRIHDRVLALNVVSTTTKGLISFQSTAIFPVFPSKANGAVKWDTAPAIRPLILLLRPTENRGSSSRRWTQTAKFYETILNNHFPKVIWWPSFATALSSGWWGGRPSLSMSMSVWGEWVKMGFLRLLPHLRIHSHCINQLASNSFAVAWLSHYHQTLILTHLVHLLFRADIHSWANIKENVCLNDKLSRDKST